MDWIKNLLYTPEKEEAWTFVVSKGFDWKKFLKPFIQDKKVNTYHFVASISRGDVIEIFCTKSVKNEIETNMKSHCKEVQKSTKIVFANQK